MVAEDADVSVAEDPNPYVSRGGLKLEQALKEFNVDPSGQSAVDIRVLQGERPVAADNSALGVFRLDGIPAAPRGMPQIEVQFDIDANGILHVTAKDKATGKSQNIVIKASSGLSDDEVDAMVSDAEAHEEEDRKFRELVDARNQADGLIHASEKSLSELGEKASGEDRHAVEAAIGDLKAVLESGDQAAIEAKTSALAEASATIAQKLYAEQAAEEGDAAPGDDGAKADDVVDAEFEEVDGDDESKSA